MTTPAPEPIHRLPPGVAGKLGYYVYLYVDPRTDQPFYVGKGVGERVLDHLTGEGESRKHRIIAELRERGLQPRLEILAHGLENEACAFRVEAAAIDLLGLGSLANQMRGWRSLQFGRMSLAELVGFYAAEPVEVVHPVLLIRINQMFYRGMPAQELLEATRGVWRLGERRAQARYALAVFEGVVQAVYAIESWHPAGTLPYETRPLEDVRVEGRWEFAGRPAPGEIGDIYMGRSVADYFRRGQQNPVVYVNC